MNTLRPHVYINTAKARRSTEKNSSKEIIRLFRKEYFSCQQQCMSTPIATPYLTAIAFPKIKQ